MDDDLRTKSLEILRYALNPDRQEFPVIEPDEYGAVLCELQEQTVAALAVPRNAKTKGVPDAASEKWKRIAYQQVFRYSMYMEAQSAVIRSLNTRRIPFVILKGTSAGCYYPRGELREMGDIDIMTAREDIDRACSALEDIGYARFETDHEFGRTIKYIKDGIEVEIHKYYTSLNDPDQAEYLDKLILDNIRPGTTKLPDGINGLVLLEHISDHLEHGLGLRQIVDWMMYVRTCLDDRQWYEWFEQQAIRIGLKNLAVTVTRMCQVYLGLDETIQWCRTADEKVCEKLMSYIMASGNFGIKEAADIERRETIEAMTNHHGIFQMICLLQEYGENNWKLLRKYRFLKPFAWIYQACRSVKKRIKSHTNTGDVIAEYRESKNRKALFDELGVKQYSKGLAVLKNDHFEIQK